MPSLICSSRYTVDSQILRKAAQSLGWETLRLDGNNIPEWFEPPDKNIAFFYTAPHVFDIAQQLGRTLVGCNPSWAVDLPPELLVRELQQMPLRDAQQISGLRFVKHAVSKAFPAAVYDTKTLIDTTSTIHPGSLVHVGEPVEWECEFRCFVADKKIKAVSAYVYDGEIVADIDSFPCLSEAEVERVRTYAQAVLNHPQVTSPPAFVLDVGIIKNRGWAVVECNECWASGIYACDPNQVLATLLCGSAESDKMQTCDWDFQRHYFSACPK